MKCPQCRRNQLRGKEGMTCKSCSYRFVFDPQSGNITDGKFMHWVAKASQNGTNYFTKEELYHTAAIRSKWDWGGIIGTIILTVFLTVGVSMFHELAASHPIFMGIAIFIILALIVHGILYSRRKLPIKRFNKYLQKWQKKSSISLDKLIDAPSISAPSPQREEDIFYHGYHKLIICQHDVQVDWLVKNDIYASQQAVVISESGYPQHLESLITDEIANNPHLKVTLLHDASTEGEEMTNRITERWSLRPEQITDAGITDEFLDAVKVKRSVRKEFGKVFPLHALPFHFVEALLSRSLEHSEIGEAASFAIIYETSGGDLDSSDGDFG